MKWRKRWPIRKLQLEWRESSQTTTALTQSLAGYCFGTHQQNEKYGLLRNKRKVFARLTRMKWILFGLVPDCIVNRAAKKLSRRQQIPFQRARYKVLSLIAELRERTTAA